MLINLVILVVLLIVGYRLPNDIKLLTRELLYTVFFGTGIYFVVIATIFPQTASKALRVSFFLYSIFLFHFDLFFKINY